MAIDPASDFEVLVYYDGDCPLCMREVAMVMRRDRRHAIRFDNIAAKGFDARSTGLDFQTLMKNIHGQLPNGERIEGVEVFRRMYAAVGFRRLAAISRVAGIRQLLDVVYALFARNRLRLTGRCADASCEVRADRAAG